MALDSSELGGHATQAVPSQCYFIAGYLVVALIVSGFVIVAIHLGWWPALEHRHLIRAHFISGAFGAMGAAVAGIRKLYQALITQSSQPDGVEPRITWGFGWIYYYLTRPLLGGVLGALTLLFSYVGFHILSESEQAKLSSEGTLVLYALAFLSGFAVSRALDRTRTVARRILSANGDG